MNSQSPIPSSDTQSKTSILNFLRSNIVGTVTASVAVSVVMLGASTWNIWTTYQGFRTSVVNQFRLKTLSDQVVHLDEVLTMSARMAASTGDPKWEKRYFENEPDLTKAINVVTEMASAETKQNSAQTDSANTRLIELEEQAFELIGQGNKEQALQLLLGPEYQQNKDIYSAGIQGTIKDVNTRIDNELTSYQGRLVSAVAFTGISCILLIAGWSFILYVVRYDIRRREQAERDLQYSQSSLQTSNASLEKTQQDLAIREQKIREENELLQREIGDILDAVSALEAGDFTQQVEVGAGVTGLVSDVLNQLIEEMSRVISTVNGTALQVSNGASDVKQLAASTSERVQQQVESIEHVQDLMAQVNQLSESSLSQAKISSDSFQNAQKEVGKGEAEMTNMKDGIVSLQEGTEQISRRVTSLNAFVDMAAQFAQSQKRVASLTRVLAFNASMVATRAAEQQDPEQFASVAREFGAIATQVNDLAGQTNQSLETLLQRTQQIQSAVSGINDDTQEINVLVDDFTHSVEQSSRAFETIKTVTNEMTQLGQRVTESSEQITEAAGKTLRAIQTIQSDGVKAESQSQMTREQASLMGQIAEQLLERMKFFKVASIPVEASTVGDDSIQDQSPEQSIAQDDTPLSSPETKEYSLA